MDEDERWRQGAVSAQRTADEYLFELRNQRRSLDRLLGPYIKKAIANRAERIVFPHAIWDQAREIDSSLLVPDADGSIASGKGKISGLPVYVED